MLFKIIILDFVHGTIFENRDVSEVVLLRLKLNSVGPRGTASVKQSQCFW
jgi:hypothetical protein